MTTMRSTPRLRVMRRPGSTRAHVFRDPRDGTAVSVCLAINGGLLEDVPDATATCGLCVNAVTHAENRELIRMEGRASGRPPVDSTTTRELAATLAILAQLEDAAAQPAPVVPAAQPALW